MGNIRPVITNFSAGELSPKIDGRIDLPVYAAGAKELTNFQVEALGGIRRRGGSQFVISTKTQDGPSRLIPWNVSDTLDFLIVLSDQKIHILDVSSGHTIGWVQSGGADLEITSLSSISTIPTYGESDLMEVKYAQSIREIVMVHPDYRAFRMKFISFDEATGEIILEYGTCSFTGNIAYSPELDDAATETTVISYEHFISTMRVLPPYDAGDPDTIIVATGKINGKTVSNIRKIVTARARKATVTMENYGVFNIKNGSYGPVDVLDASVPNTYIFGNTGGGDYFGIGPSEKVSLFFHDDGKAASTKTAFLDKCEANLEGDGRPYIAVDSDWTTGKDIGSVRFYKSGSDVTFRITFADTSTLDIPASGYTGDILGYISVADYFISINKTTVPGYQIMDSCATWMTPNIPYDCSGDSILNGRRIISATKQIKKVTSPYSGNLMEVPVLTCETEGTAEPFEITRESDAISGLLGVILTPFYKMEDNPSFVCFHQGRLVVGASRAEPNVLWMSKVNDYFNFSLFEEVEYTQTELLPSSQWTDPGVPETTTTTNIVQQVGAANAIRIQLATEESEAIRSASSISDLIINTATSEWIFPAGLDATNSRVQMTTRNGSCGIQPRFIGSSLVFVSGSRTGLRAYRPEAGLKSPDIGQMADHIFANKVKYLDFRQDPRSEMYMILDNGDCIVGLMESELPAYYRIRLSGSDSVEGCAIIAAGDEDAVYIQTERIIDGSSVRSIERIKTNDDSTFLTRVYLDFFESGTTGAASIPIPSHLLAGSSVDSRVRMVLMKADGSEFYGTPIVDGVSGEIDSLMEDGETVAVDMSPTDQYIIGIPFKSRFKSFRIDSASTEGIPKQGGYIHFRVYRSGMFSLKKDDDATYNQVVDNPDSSVGIRIYPYTGPIRSEYEAPQNTDQSIVIETEGHEPVGIQLIAMPFSVGGM